MADFRRLSEVLLTYFLRFKRRFRIRFESCFQTIRGEKQSSRDCHLTEQLWIIMIMQICIVVRSLLRVNIGGVEMHNRVMHCVSWADAVTSACDAPLNTRLMKACIQETEREACSCQLNPCRYFLLQLFPTLWYYNGRIRRCEAKVKT